jgi:hypothetical protein
MKLIYEFLIILAAMLVINYYYIVVKNRYPNHPFWAGVRGAAFAVLAYMAYPAWGDRVMVFIGFNAAFWLPFDISINLLRGKSWLYIPAPPERGYEDKRAFTDRLGYEWPAAFFYTRVLFLIYGIATLSYDLTQLHIYAN